MSLLTGYPVSRSVVFSRVAVPDFDELMRMRKFGYQLPYEDIIMGARLTTETITSLSGVTINYSDYMTDLGLSEIKTWQSEIEDCASFIFSLNLQGVKNV